MRSCFKSARTCILRLRRGYRQHGSMKVVLPLGVEVGILGHVNREDMVEILGSEGRICFSVLDEAADEHWKMLQVFQSLD